MNSNQETEIQKAQTQKISPHNKGTDSLWEKDGHDYILHLGTMRKAIVVAAYFDNKKSSFFQACLSNRIDYYSISPRSYFPFKDVDFERKFNNPDECKEYAISCVKDWLKSVFNITWSVDKS